MCVPLQKKVIVSPTDTEREGTDVAGLTGKVQSMVTYAPLPKGVCRSKQRKSKNTFIMTEKYEIEYEDSKPVCDFLV